MEEGNFLRKIWSNKIDELVHLQFQKFSKGEFKGKALISSSFSKDTYKISTTAEFANELVRAVAGKLGDKKTRVTGAIISTRDLSSEISFKDKKQFMGIKQYVIDTEMSGKEILALCDKLHSAFFALSFKTDGTELKIKAKAPKSAKPSSRGEAKKAPDFCKIITTDKKIAEDILFDLDMNNSKKVDIEHTFLIKEIIIPKNEKDPSKMREMAKRKGIIIRKVLLDGKEIIKEKEFTA